MEERIKQSTVNELINLKKCPFCGCTPNVFEAEDNRYVIGENNWVIECKDMGCIVQRSSPNRSLLSLLGLWNRRTL